MDNFLSNFFCGVAIGFLIISFICLLDFLRVVKNYRRLYNGKIQK